MGVKFTYCCHPSVQKNFIKQETIKIAEIQEITPEPSVKKMSIVEDENPPRPPQQRVHSSNFLQTKLNNLKINNPGNNRRKSFSIAINPEPTNIKQRNRSKSTLGMELQNDITNFQMKKAYKILPNQASISTNEKETNSNQLQVFTKTSSLISEDTTMSHCSSPNQKKKQSIELINEPFTEKQLRVLKKILFKEELIVDDMDESTM